MVIGFCDEFCLITLCYNDDKERAIIILQKKIKKIKIKKDFFFQKLFKKLVVYLFLKIK